MDVETGKIMAGVGAILLIVGPFFYGVVGIVGLILVLVGLLTLADHFKDAEMRRNAIQWVIFAIIAIVALVVAFALELFALWSFMVPPYAYSAMSELLVIIAGLVVAEIFYVLSASRLRRVYATLAQRTGESLFNTAGTLYFWGAVLTIVLVGGILMLISWILAAVAFFTAKITPPQQPSQ